MAKLKKESSREIFIRAEKLRQIAEADPTSEIKRQTYERTLALAEETLSAELIERGMKFKTLAERSDWWEAVKHLYRIIEKEDSVLLISETRDWHERRSWEFENKWHAWAKIEKLIQYKNNDRKSGKGSREKDFERVELILARRSGEAGKATSSAVP